VIVKQQKTGSVDVTLKQPVSNGIDHSKQNNEHIVIDDSTDQSILIPLENFKPLVPDESTQHKEIAIIHDSTKYPTSATVNSLMQTFEQMSSHETISEYLPQRINSGTSNKRPISANSQQ
jgi:hypothetical protein